MHVSEILWKVTTPAFVVPSVLRHATQLVGVLLGDPASNSALDPADAGLPVQVCVINGLMDSDTFHEVRELPNCVHWLYAVVTGTSTSMDSSTVATGELLPAADCWTVRVPTSRNVSVVLARFLLTDTG